VPSAEDLKPSYQQFAYDPAEKHGKLRLIAAPNGGAPPAVAKIHQDTRIFASVLTPGETVEYAVPPGRHAWMHCAEGNITMNGMPFKEGDGAAISDEKALAFTGTGDQGGEFLIFDLA
jgi:quercetin 2,3-dioxygenase